MTRHLASRDSIWGVASAKGPSGPESPQAWSDHQRGGPAPEGAGSPVREPGWAMTAHRHLRKLTSTKGSFIGNKSNAETLYDSPGVILTCRSSNVNRGGDLIKGVSTKAGSGRGRGRWVVES